MIKKILVTGGAGYIGSHTVLRLLESGFDVVVIDNLSNSSPESLRRVEYICGRKTTTIIGDVRDRALLDKIFEDHDIDSVIHFAGLKAVAESVAQPLRYYNNNVHGTEVLLDSMKDANVFKFLFSSSATVYGESAIMPVSESCTISNPTNPYGRTKYIVEQMLNDLASSDERWKVAILRYFNPAGAHISGLIGEDSDGTPNNLLPFITQVAIGKLDELLVFGNDYPTKDGTGVRDYIHVEDLADGHLRALEAVNILKGVQTWNLGTGQGYSVMEIIRAFEFVSGLRIPYRIVPRRPGDISVSCADPSLASTQLGWKAKRGLIEMMRDTWHWQTSNPDGYNS